MDDIDIFRAPIKHTQREKIYPNIFGHFVRKKGHTPLPAYSVAESNFMRLMDTHISRENQNSGYGYFAMESIYSNTPDALDKHTAIIFVDSDEEVTLTNPDNYCEVQTTMRAASIAAWLKTLTMFASEYYYHGENQNHTAWSYQGDSLFKAGEQLFRIYSDLKHFLKIALNTKYEPLLSKAEADAIGRFIN